MEWLFCINPRVITGFVSALGCFYFLCICMEDIKTLIAYRCATRPRTKPRARHERVRFPHVAPYTNHIRASVRRAG